MERERKKEEGRQEGGKELYTKLFVRTRPRIYIYHSVYIHWRELSQIATPSSKGLVSSCAAMWKALKLLFRRFKPRELIIERKSEARRGQM